MNTKHRPAAPALVLSVAPGLDPDAVGAKAANLAKVQQGGFRVPPGLAVTRQALQLFLTANDLLEAVEHGLAEAGAGPASDQEERYRALCQHVLDAPLPPALLEALEGPLTELLASAPHGLAVRSSGIYEDSANASFAGVYESYLGIRTHDYFYRALKNCWCAAWAPAALAYAGKMDIAPEADALAVLVQPLLAADSAGVLFTADPQTGNPWRFALESTFGLGQDLVGAAGGLPVDRFVFAWDSGRIIDKQIARKETICRPSDTGVETVALDPQRGDQASLDDETATRLAQLALDLDRAFDARVDIEWVLNAGELYIVQVRPITALPDFFPHHLPQRAAEQTWTPATLWHIPYRQHGPMLQPLYRDLLIGEKYSRYFQIGPVDMPPHLRPGGEADFNGYRYMLADNQWPHVPDEQREAYLEQYEAVLRRDYLDAFQQRYPAMGREALLRQDTARTLPEQIDSLLWARDATFDMFSLTGGPSQSFFAICSGLLRNFLAQYAPDCDTEGLQQGHHPELDPYYPQVQVGEAEQLAQHIGADRPIFAQKDDGALLDFLLQERLDAPFVQALEDYCLRFGLVPPSELTAADENSRGPIRFILRLVLGALKGTDSVAERHDRATRQRQQCVAAIRQRLEADCPEQLPRFERLFDWALFWGPALNNRAWTTVHGSRLGKLWHLMRERLQHSGLLDAPADIDYFSVADLAHIAATGDIAEGRRILRQRRRECEANARLVAPPHLGPAPQSPDEQAAQPTTAPSTVAPTGPVIQGRGGVPGRAEGVAFKLNSLDEAEAVGEEHVLVFARPLQPSSATTPLLFSLTLRVRALVSPQGPMMWMHHIGQIARECGVPVVQIAPEDIERIGVDARLAVDGRQGTVTLLE